MQFIALQGTYNFLSLGFFLNATLYGSISFDGIRASSNLVPLLEKFLNDHNTKLEQLSFIAIDKGPGAFTSLRATIASINGIAHATKIPLIGINSLEALQIDTLNALSKTPKFIVTLLNAYNNDVYFRIFDCQNNSLIKESCEKIDLVIQRIIELQSPAVCSGNGTTLHQELLTKTLQNNFLPIPNNLEVPSVEVIGKLAYNMWLEDPKKHSVESIEPYYLKTQLFAIKQ